MIRYLILILIVLTLLVNVAFAGDAGQESLFITGAGARALGMGGAFTSVADDASTIFYNPAGLGSIPNHEFTLMHATFFEGTQYNYIGWVYPTLKLGGFGIGLMRVGTDDIIRRNNYIDIGSFGFSNLQLLLSYGNRIHEKISLGTNFKIVYQSIDHYSDYGLALDFGIKAQLTEHISTGFIARDIVPAEIKLISTKESFPTSIVGGLSYKNSFYDDMIDFIAAFEIEKNENRSFKVHAGSELTFSNKYSLRAGYDRDNISFGLGYIYNNLLIDYTYKVLDYIDDSHRFSLSFLIGHTVKQRQQSQIKKQESIGSRLIIDEKAKSFELYKAKADGFFYQLQFDSALSYYNSALAFDEDNEEIKNIIFTIEYTIRNEKLSELENIQKEFEISTTVNNYLLQTRNFYSKKNYLAALDMLGLVFEIDLNNSEAIQLKQQIDISIESEIKDNLEMAKIAGETGKLITAIEAYTRILQLDPNNVDARNGRDAIGAELNLSQQLNKGIDQYNRAKYKDASRTFRAVLSVYPSEPIALEYLRKMQPRGEKPITLQDIQNDKEIWKLYLDGLRFMRDKEYQDAINVWEEVLKKYPLNKETRDNIEQARLRLNAEESK